MTVHDNSPRSSAEPVTQWTPPSASPPATGTPPGRPKRNPKLVIAGALVAVAIASGGVTAGIMAATGQGTGSSVAGAPGTGSGGGFGGRGGGFGGGMTAALHGTYVVSDGNGGYSTELTQTGTVSAISSSAITVKSEDGYSKTYAITSSTSVDNGSDQIGSVAAGNTVRIVADAKASATAITDTNLAGGQNQGGQNQAGQNQGAGSGNGQPSGQ
ncbi:MAG TPA: hypothetical protein VGD29_12815 [Actinoplanes sp.]